MRFRSSFFAAAVLVAGVGEHRARAEEAKPAAKPAPEPGPAADAAPAGRELTLEQALAMAKRANKNIVVERARLAQAQVGLEQAWAVLFPTLTVQGKYSRNNKQFMFQTANGTLTIQPVNQLDGAVSFSTLLFAPAVYTGLKAVESRVDAAQAGLEASEDNVLFSVAQGFYAAAIADEVVAARTSSIDVVRATSENARTRFAAGTVTKIDVDRAELAVLRAEQARREALLGREQAYRALGTLIGAEEGFRVRPIDRPGGGGAGRAGASDGGRDMEMVLKLRPEFQALVATARADELERRSYAWRWAPSISGFGNARIFNYQNFAFDHHAWVVGATLDWVIYDGGNRDASRHLAAAQAAEALARAEVLRDSIRDDLANGRRALETKSEAQRTAERSVELAREAVDLVRIQYEAGASTQVDLLQAQDSLVTAREALAQAHFDVAVADLTLRRAAGTFPGR